MEGNGKTHEMTDREFAVVESGIDSKDGKVTVRRVISKF
jgi:hypothetical protein